MADASQCRLLLDGRETERRGYSPLFGLTGIIVSSINLPSMTNDKFYVITRLHKDDIKQEFPELADQIDALADDEMAYSAEKMAEAYLDDVSGCYWNSLREIAEEVLKEKQ
jgi:hypothetical protein